MTTSSTQRTRINYQELQETVTLLDRITRGTNGQPGLIARLEVLTAMVASLREEQQDMRCKIDALVSGLNELKTTLLPASTSWERARDRFVFPVLSAVATAVVTYLILQNGG